MLGEPSFSTLKRPLMPIAKTLGDPAEQSRRLEFVTLPHVGPLDTFAARIRAERGCGREVPWFDPLDGGIGAPILFLLAVPGPKAVNTGFVSRDNPDESAENWLLANEAACLDRRLTVTWNVILWYLGDGVRIRSPRSSDIRDGLSYLVRLLSVLPALRVIGMVGSNACTAERTLRATTKAALVRIPHPSPRNLNARPGARLQLAESIGACRVLLYD